MQKRNFKTRSYQSYSIPKEWDCPLVTDDMDKIVNCASCGTKLPFGDCFTSRAIHTPMGFGYSVCGVCNKKEYKTIKG